MSPAKMFDISESIPFRCLGKPTLIYPLRAQRGELWSTFAELELWGERNIREPCDIVLEKAFQHAPLIPNWHAKAEISEGGDYSTDQARESHQNYLRLKDNGDFGNEDDDEDDDNVDYRGTARVRRHEFQEGDPDAFSAIRRIELLDREIGSSPNLREYYDSLALTDVGDKPMQINPWVVIWKRIMLYMSIDQLKGIYQVSRVLSRFEQPQFKALQHCIPHLTCAHFTAPVRLIESDERFKLLTEIPLSLPRSTDGVRLRRSCFALAVYIKAMDQAWGNRKGDILVGYYAAQGGSISAIGYHMLLKEPIEHEFRIYRVLLKHNLLLKSDVVRIFARTGGGGGHSISIRDFGWIRCCHQIINIDTKSIWSKKICQDQYVRSKIRDLIAEYLDEESRIILSYALRVR